MSHATPPVDILIVGGGHGGAQAAIALRQSGYSGAITIITEETDLPYERPPLTKEYFSKEKPFERIQIRPQKFWDERNVNFVLGHRICSVDAAGHSVTDEQGDTCQYGKLIWAAGGHPRRLSCSGNDLAGIHSIRTRADVDELESELALAERIVVIGGGYIGLEAAAVLVKTGKSVTVIEMQDRVLARVAAEPVSRFYEAEHRRHGVQILLECSIDGIEGANGKVTGVRLTDGRLLPADIIIVGIGIVPAVQPLLAAGAVGTDGVDVDEFCRTSLPDVYAIGDCARHLNAFSDGRRMRVESVQNATDQAITAARHILGQEQPYAAVPWFWSNQYNLKLQTVGINIGYDQVVLRGDTAKQSFSAIYLRNGAVIALDCVNAMVDYVQGKGLVTNHCTAPPAALTNISVPLKSLISTNTP